MEDAAHLYTDISWKNISYFFSKWDLCKTRICKSLLVTMKMFNLESLEWVLKLSIINNDMNKKLKESDRSKKWGI